MERMFAFHLTPKEAQRGYMEFTDDEKISFLNFILRPEASPMTQLGQKLDAPASEFLTKLFIQINHGKV